MSLAMYKPTAQKGEPQLIDDFSELMIDDTPITNLDQLVPGEIYVITSTNRGIWTYVGTFYRIKNIETDPTDSHFQFDPTDVQYVLGSTTIFDSRFNNAFTGALPGRNYGIYKSNSQDFFRDNIMKHASLIQQKPTPTERPMPQYNYQDKPQSQLRGGRTKRTKRTKKNKRVKRRMTGRRL